MCRAGLTASPHFSSPYTLNPTLSTLNRELARIKIICSICMNGVRQINNWRKPAF